jgi:hypothetical protein
LLASTTLDQFVGTLLILRNAELQGVDAMLSNFRITWLLRLTSCETQQKQKYETLHYMPPGNA